MRSHPAVVAPESRAIPDCLARMAAAKRDAAPLSTYRVQFHAGFRFADARRLVGYLHALGISHLYSSPVLQARAGSLHGYDITDHNRLNPEVGGYEELRSLARELAGFGMGQVLDFVPNHMGVGSGGNPWWQDVLANGRTSRFADFFDVEWEPLKPELRDKLLLPVLGDQYGAELEAGRIRLQLDKESFFISYNEARLPIDPQTIPMIFEPVVQGVDAGGEAGAAAAAARQELHGLLSQLRDLPPHSVGDRETARGRRQAVAPLLDHLARLLRGSSWAKDAAAKAVLLHNGRQGEPRSFDRLHWLLEAQVYRLANWRVSGEEINYRRFFDVNDLIGLSMENPRVFAATHELLRRLLAENLVQGVRIDHCDGLLNPRQYLVRLQMLYAASRCVGPAAQPPLAENGIELEVQEAFNRQDWNRCRPPLYSVVEKILSPGEELPREWPVDGASGYDFTALVNGLFIDGRHEKLFTNVYHRFIGASPDVDWVIYNSKKQIMHASLAGEVNVLAHLLDAISAHDRYARDFTRKALRDVIRETIACFPVYRTYIDDRGAVIERDVAIISEAIVRAKRRNPDKAPASFDFLRDVLLLKRRETEDPPEQHRKKLRFTLKFQQLTGPVMAKGLEDTAFYIYNRFVAVNEVGGSPKQFGAAVVDFHRRNHERAERWPFSMLATSTHDTKRSEDVRARLDVLSEMPKAWATQVFRWRRLNRSRKRSLGDGRTVPSLNEEYLLYQTLAGTWPFAFPTPESRCEYVERIQRYMSKAVHEAKVNLSWINPDPAYVDALHQFIAGILRAETRSRANAFLQRFESFLPAIVFFGAVNSVAQRLLMITAPGNPDIYQGMELWDFSLVDPDNRRPVDFPLRRGFLDELDARADAGDLAPLCRELLESYQDGRIKLWTTMRALRLRRARRVLFHEGSYLPLDARGAKREHVVAYARVNGGQAAIVAVPRLSFTLAGGAVCPPLGDLWGDTEIAAPADLPHAMENVFTGQRIQAPSGRALLCREIFAHFPVALLAGG